MSDQPKSGQGAPQPKMQTMSRHTMSAQTQKQRPAQSAAPGGKGPARQAAPAEAEPETQAEELASEEEYEAWAAEHPDEAARLEAVTIGMAKGEISPAEAYGITMEDMAEAAVLGSEQLEKGNLESAVIIFEGLVTAEPKIPQFRVSLGQCYEKLGFTEEALDSYASGIILYAAIEEAKLDDIVDAMLLRSTLLIREGRDYEAIDDLSKIVPENLDLNQASPALAQCYILLMNALERVAKIEEAAAAAQPAADAAPAGDAPPA